MSALRIGIEARAESGSGAAITGLLALAAAVIVALAAGVARGRQAAPPAPVARDDAAAERLGWRLGVQAWTFRDRTAFEAIDTAARLGIKYIELFPGQALGPDQREIKVGPDMGAAPLDALKQKLASAKVRAIAFGVVGMKNDPVATRPVFEFARQLGLEYLSAEPDRDAPGLVVGRVNEDGINVASADPQRDALDLVATLADEYGINVAIHNHPRPSPYWNPDTVLAASQGRTKRIGSCSDTGHWTRSGLVPVDCLKKLEGRVLGLHFKDLGEFGKHEAIDLPWGTGKSDARGILAELKRQRFKGLISVEYEDGSGELLEKNVARCIAFFDQTARELSAGAP